MSVVTMTFLRMGKEIFGQFPDIRGPVFEVCFGAPLTPLCIPACCTKLHYSRVHLNMKAKCIYSSEQMKALAISKCMKQCKQLHGLQPSLPLVLGSIFLFAASKCWVQPTDFYVSGDVIKKSLYVCRPRSFTWFWFLHICISLNNLIRQQKGKRTSQISF